MDEQAYFAAQERKSEHKVAWEYGRLLELAGLKDVKGWRVLDAGCGAGPGLRFFSARGTRVCGLDQSAYALQRARRLAPEAWLVQANLRAGLPLAEGSFDLVLLADVLEHIADGKLLLQECQRVLRAHGALVVRTVNRWDVRRFLQGHRWSGVADPSHVHLYSPAELRQALREAGFLQVRVRAGVKPVVWMPVRWPVGVPWPPLLGNGLVAIGFRGY